MQFIIHILVSSSYHEHWSWHRCSESLIPEYQLRLSSQTCVTHSSSDLNATYTLSAGQRNYVLVVFVTNRLRLMDGSILCWVTCHAHHNCWSNIINNKHDSYLIKQWRLVTLLLFIKKVQFLRTSMFDKNIFHLCKYMYKSSLAFLTIKDLLITIECR